MTETHHTLHIKLADGDSLPTAFRIFRAGVNETRKGSFTFDDEAAAAVMAAFAEHGMDRLPIDVDHGMLNQSPTLESSKAHGWFVPELRNGELWASDVQWSNAASEALREREFRFISPAFSAPNGRIMRLLNVALTNLPATQNLEPLVANQSAHRGNNTGETMKLLLDKLSAKDEAEALSVVHGWETTTTELLNITNTKKLSDAIEAIKAGRVALSDVVTLTAKVAELEGEKETTQREALITKLNSDGKAPPAMHALLRKMSIVQLNEFAQVAPVVGASSATQPGASSGNVISLNGWQKNLCTQMGIKEDDYIARLKAERDEKEGAA